MDSDYYTFSPYPSTMQRLVVDDREVGQHYTMINADGETVYCARIDLEKNLPPASITSKRRESEELKRFGPQQKLNQALLDELYTARSDAYPFPAELLGLDLQAEHHDRLRRRSVYIQSLPGAYGNASDPGGLVIVDVVLGNEQEDLKAAIGLALSVARGALRISDEDRRYRDAYEALGGAAARGDPSPEQLEAVMKHIAGATSWVTGQPARVGDAIETRLRLEEVSEELRGTLHVYWQDALLSTVDVHLEGELPLVDDAQATLSPAEKGFWGFLKSFGELKTGDQALDDAFFIQTEADDAHPARNLIVHSREHLMELGRFGAHVDFTPERVKVRVSAVPYEATSAAALVSTLLELWRRAVLFRAGFAAKIDDTALDPQGR